MRYFLILLVLCLTVFIMPAAAQEGDPPLDSPFAGDPELPAPEFPDGLDWINVEQPLALASLRGKIVLLDFWTYGCINCIHMIPVIEALEEKYGDALVVIGVHSAKFENEGTTSNIRQIVQRYELAHPVINDSDFLVWRRYGVQAWPTFAVIDPRGNLLARQAGEIPFAAFDRLFTGMVSFWEDLGELNREPLALALEGAGTPPGVLAFPGKVVADAAGNRLFIADTNHHRIIIADLTTYAVLNVIGTGESGFSDGTGTATFNKPQGMALQGDTLYVADTENHAIRAIDLTTQTVTTLAGTGVQGYPRLQVGAQTPGADFDLSSPWDVAFGDDPNLLYIAMAGPHQLWALALDQDNAVGPIVGDGREAALNQSLATSQLAQPSGLFYRDGQLYFADSESSTIRVADFAADTVSTVAGTTDNNLFDFGDIDGALGVSRLQHPLGVTGSAQTDDIVYVADTYNSRIKALDPTTMGIVSVFGSGGIGGFRDGVGLEAAFDEPGGISYADGRLYVADTNNHAIRVIDLATATVSTVVFPNPDTLQIADQVTVIGGTADDAVTLEAQALAVGVGEIAITIALPDGYKINPDAPSQVVVTVDGDGVALDGESETPFREAEVRLPLTLTEGAASVTVTVTTYYCEAVNETLCFFDEAVYTVPVSVTAAADSGVIAITRALVPPVLVSGGL